MTWRHFLSACLCAGACVFFVCLCLLIAHMCVCLRSSRQLSPDPFCPSFMDASLPPATARTLCSCTGLTVDFYRGAPQPLGRAGTAAPAFSAKPSKASFSRVWEEAFDCGCVCVGRGEPKRMEKKGGSSKGFEPQIASRCVPLESE